MPGQRRCPERQRNGDPGLGRIQAQQRRGDAGADRELAGAPAPASGKRRESNLRVDAGQRAGQPLAQPRFDLRQLHALLCALLSAPARRAGAGTDRLT
jgi:hypothetical protein